MNFNDPIILLLTYSVLIGLTPLIPIPILDDLVKSYFYRRLVRSLAAVYDLSLTADEIAILAEERGAGCLKGCLWGTAEYLIKRLVRKAVIVLEWRRAIDLVTHTYYYGHLLNHALQQSWYAPGDSGRAMQLRTAIEQARAGANTNLVKRIVQSSFNQSRQLVVGMAQQVSESVQDIALRRTRDWLRRTFALRLRQRAPRLARRLYRFLRPSAREMEQAARAEAEVAQALDREAPRLNQALTGLVTQLQAGILSLPQEHFEVLEKRLAHFIATL